MKKIISFLFLSLLFLPLTVNASAGQGWINSVNQYTRVTHYSNTYGIVNQAQAYIYLSMSMSDTSTSTTEAATVQKLMYYNSESVLLGPKGSGFSARVGLLDKGTLYSYNSYVCSNKNLFSGNLNISLHKGKDDFGFEDDTLIFEKHSITQIEEPGNTIANINMPYCYIISSMIVPSSKANSYSYVDLEFSRSSTEQTSGTYYYVIGYDFETVGYYRSEYASIIESALTSSNVATKTDIQEVKDKTEEVKQEVKKVDETLKDDTVDGSTETGNSFFSNFESDTFGLTSVITSPLNLIKSLTSKQCSPLILDVPYLSNQKLTLPCMSIIYSEYFGTFLSIYQTITFGLIAYWVCVKLFALVKDFKNPDSDKVEVMDL